MTRAGFPASSERDIDPKLQSIAAGYACALACDRPLPEAPAADVAWIPALKETCGIHGLGPLLGCRVERGEISAGDALDAWLLEQARRNRVRLQRMRGEAEALLSVLERAGLHAIPLKGAAMLLAVDDVDALAWRTIGDHDLLLIESDTGALDLAMARSGYCLQNVVWKHRRYGSCAPGPPLIVGDGEHPDNPRDVEVHPAVVEKFRGIAWDITAFMLSDLTPLDARAERLIPSPFAMALHLGVHCSIAMMNGGARAIQFIDLVRAVARTTPEQLVGAVTEAGIAYHARFLYPAVAFAARELGDAASGDVAAALRPFVPAQLPGWIANVSLHDLSHSALMHGPLVDRFVLWALSPAESARMFLHTLAPAPAELAIRAHVGEGPVPLQYLRHFRHLARRAASLRNRG